MKKIRRVAAMICMTLMVVCCLPMMANAASKKSGTTGKCTWVLDGTKLTISGKGAMEDYSYNENGELVLPWGNKITSVVIKDGVKSIGDYAFSMCNKLKSVSISDSVKTIGKSAFYACSELQKITLPKNLREIGSASFVNCEKLKSINIPKGVKYIGIYTFMECRSLENITISNGLEGVGPYCFGDCSGLVNIKLPDSVTHIYEGAFAGCDGLKTIEIPYSVKTIEDNVFWNCSSKLEIHGYAGSCAQTYAKKEGLNFVRIQPSVKLSATTYTYDGNVKKPTVIVRDTDGKKLTLNKDYTLSYAKGRKCVGKYSVKVTFKGKYSGSKTLYFTIKPKSTSMKKVTATSKGFTVTWNKLTAQTTGYQIQYSTSSSFSNKKTVTVSNNKTTSKSIKSLKANKKYYIRIRTYKTIGNTKYYSAWSSTKTVTTKK